MCREGLKGGRQEELGVEPDACLIRGKGWGRKLNRDAEQGRDEKEAGQGLRLSCCEEGKVGGHSPSSAANMGHLKLTVPCTVLSSTSMA